MQQVISCSSEAVFDNKCYNVQIILFCFILYYVLCYAHVFLICSMNIGAVLISYPESCSVSYTVFAGTEDGQVSVFCQREGGGCCWGVFHM